MATMSMRTTAIWSTLPETVPTNRLASRRLNSVTLMVTSVDDAFVLFIA